MANFSNTTTTTTTSSEEPKSRLFYFGKLVHDLSMFDGKVIASIACGAAHYMILTAENELYSVGSNLMGQLGLGTENNSDEVRVPARVSIPCNYMLDVYNEKIAKISTKGWHNLVLLSSGRVFVNGSNKYGQLGFSRARSSSLRVLTPIPLHEEFPDLKIDYISAGVNHSVIATRDGNVFTSGWGQHGQTGHNSRTDLGYFKEVEFFKELPAHKKQIRDISSGGEHSMILTMDGVVFVMGHYGAEDHLLPTPIDSMDQNDNFVVQIASGDFFGMLLTSKNTLLSFGDNERGQCGIGASTRFAPAPRKVIFYGDDEQTPIRTPRIRKIIAGSSHSFCIAGHYDDERVFAWGRGESDRLGHFDYGINHYAPTEIKCVRGMGVKQISASGMYTMLSTTEYIESRDVNYLIQNLRQLVPKTCDKFFGCSEEVSTPKFVDICIVTSA